MKKHTITILFVAVAILFATASHAGATKAVKFFGTAEPGDISPRIALKMERTGVDVEGFACFQLPIYDLASGRPLGTGVDCLNVYDAMGDAAGDGVQIEAKTFFFFPQGTVVNHGCTSVRPFFAGVGDAGATHMSGSIPPSEFGADASPAPACEEAGGVIHATRRFAGTSGDVRLSGAVNLGVPGQITFSCIFVLDLHPPGWGNDD